MRRALAIVLGTVALAAAVPASPVSARACAEDAPCWTWSTMGNLTRGVTLVGGRRAVVDAGALCRLERRHRIDWKRSARLRGDYLAKTRGCDGRLFAQPA